MPKSSIVLAAAFTACETVVPIHTSSASAGICSDPRLSVDRTIHDTLFHNPVSKFVGADAKLKS